MKREKDRERRKGVIVKGKGKKGKRRDNERDAKRVKEETVFPRGCCSFLCA